MGRHYWFALTMACVFLPMGCRGPMPKNHSSATPQSSTPFRESKLNPLGGLERSLIFFPSRYPEGNWQPAGLHFDDAWFTSADGTRLHGWYVPHEHPRAAILFCHGNAGNLSNRAGLLRILHDRVGATVMIFDYRGFGRSEGKPGESGVLADARAARAWLADRAGIAEDQIVLMGRSLGGAVAVDLAARDGARALVLESTFTSISDVAKTMYPLLPLHLLVQTKLNSAEKIATYHGPLLQSHGTADRLIPYKIGCRLFDAANQPKQFVPIAGGDHNNPQSAEYYEALASFLDRSE